MVKSFISFALSLETTRVVFITSKRLEIAEKDPDQKVYFGLINHENRKLVVVVRVPPNLVINFVQPVITFSFKKNLDLQLLDTYLKDLTKITSSIENLSGSTYMIDKPGLDIIKIYEFLERTRNNLKYVHIPISERLVTPYQLFPAKPFQP